MLHFFRTITKILCANCLKHKDSAVLSRLFGNGQVTCERCGAQAKSN